MSIFLMGCYDRNHHKWKTVTKVHTGHDDETLERLQKELEPNMSKIKGNFDRIPEWLDCTRQMSPDFVAKDPKLSPVWEITGAEFSKAEIHTADGISIRFPRVTKIRDDKTWETATSLKELNHLFVESKNSSKFEMDDETETEIPSTSKKSPIPSSSKKSPTKRSWGQEPSSSPERTPVKKMKSESNTPSPEKIPEKKMKSEPNTLSPEKTPVKKIRVEANDIKVKLGSSGKVS